MQISGFGVVRFIIGQKASRSRLPLDLVLSLDFSKAMHMYLFLLLFVLIAASFGSSFGPIIGNGGNNYATGL